MYEQVIFYNHFGAGDVFESREFVKAWMKLVPARKYCYSHGKNPIIISDIPNLEFKEITVHMDPRRGVWDDLNGNLYVNTWIGRDGKYVLPGIGCTVEKLFQMHNDMLAIYGLGELDGYPIDYVPDIDYSKYNTAGVDKFLKKRTETKVLIDNGLVQSNQAQNFDMNHVLRLVADKHPHVAFIATQPFSTTIKNIYFTNEIIDSKNGFDLNEVSYLSTFCSTIIGRNSGPHVFCQVKKNVMDENKKMLSFTYHQQGSAFVVNSPVHIKKFWSAATRLEEVYRKVTEVLG